MKYDIIIAGSGCAGLSLLYRILKDSVLKTKKILVVDKGEKNTNDRTWCYTNDTGKVFKKPKFWKKNNKYRNGWRYTFQFIQKNTRLIVNKLRKGDFPSSQMTFRDKMFQWYDRTLLEVIISNKLEGKEIFSAMFKKLSLERILAFLGNESSFLDDIKIMNSVPTKPFLMAGLKQLK